MSMHLLFFAARKKRKTRVWSQFQGALAHRVCVTDTYPFIFTLLLHVRNLSVPNPPLQVSPLCPSIYFSCRRFWSQVRGLVYPNGLIYKYFEV